MNGSWKDFSNCSYIHNNLRNRLSPDYFKKLTIMHNTLKLEENKKTPSDEY